MIDMVSHVGSKTPIIGAVLEEIEKWHSTVGEPMHKLGFKEALGIVEGPAACSNTVKGGSDCHYKKFDM